MTKSVEDLVDSIIACKAELMVLEQLRRETKVFEEENEHINRIEKLMLKQRIDDIERRMELAGKLMNASNREYYALILEECKRKDQDITERCIKCAKNSLDDWSEIF